ncbi:MAG: glycoside hydrolase family 88 protein [Bacteroidaceae bacterium]|nr:glycoside hydrolase family 88 protein [Bacteroidaceae bacterium]
MKQNVLIVSIFLFLFSLDLIAQPQQEEVIHMLELANDHFMQKYPDPGKPTFVGKERPSNLWTRGVYFEGLMALAEVERLMGSTKHEIYKKYIYDWGEAHKWQPRNGVTTRDADDYCCCQTYLDIYQYVRSASTSAAERKREDKIRGSELLIAPTRECMDNVIAANDIPWVIGGQDKSAGSASDWTWIDAIQMGLPVFSKLARLRHLEGDKEASRYTEQGWKMYEMARNTIGGGLFNTTDGLWWRDKDFVPPYKEPNGEDCYWSRGNGWVYAALVRAMDAMLLADGAQVPQYWELLGTKKWTDIGVDAHFNDYKKDYLAMTKALVKCQRSDGFWNVSLHDESNYGGAELSGTALFIYGMAWGVRHGYLPRKKYTPLIYTSWEAMVKTCLHANGFLGYVQGTGKEPKDAQPVTYTKEPDFDDFGLGCFLLCGTEIFKLLEK